MPKKIKPECFEVLNKNGKAELFRTDDVSVNKLTFTIANLTGEPLSLTGGTPAKALRGVQQTEPGGSSFNFGFESMLTNDVVKKLTLTSPRGWNAAFFEGSETTPPSWSVAPASDIVIAVNDTVKVIIENIKCGTTKPGNFEIMYRNIPGYSDTMFPITKHLSVLNPPDSGKLPLPLTFGYINPEHPIQGQTLNEEIFDLSKLDVSGGEAVPVYITYDPAALIENGFTFILTNTSNKPLVPDADAFDFYETTGADQPVVYLSFVFGDEDYAITTQQLADNNISINVSGYLPWQPTAHIGGTAYWQFTPLSKTVMDGMETVRFPVKKIITPLNVPTDAISIMYIQVNNVPGYNDAVYTIQLQKKKAIATMLSFEVSKKDIEIGENVTLTWKSFLAKRVTIDYKTRDDQVITLDSDKGDIKLNGTDFRLPIAPTALHTIITARAYDDKSSRSLENTVEVKQRPAEIRLFTVDQPLVDISAKPDIRFTWEATNAQKLKLVTPEGEIEISKDATSHVYKGLQTAFRFTLKVQSYYHQSPEFVTAITDVFAYRSDNPITMAMPAEKIQPLPAILINKQHGRAYVVNNCENAVYDIDAVKLSADKKYPGIAMLLSQNAEKLFVFNSEIGPRTFGTTMYDTASGARSTNYSLYSQVAGPFPGIAMTVNQALTKFYVSMVFGGTYKWINVQVYTVNASGNSMFHSSTATSATGSDIFAMTLNNTGQKIYIVHNAYVEIASTDERWNKDLGLPGSMPGRFVHNRSDNKLYLACENGNTIAVIDTVSDSITKAINLKNKAANVVISPDDKYLFAAIYDSNEIAVIDTKTNEIISTITTGKSPYGMAFDNAGELLFIANYCSKTMSVFDLKNNRMLSAQLPVGTDKGNPLDIGTYDDKDGNIRVFVAKEAYSQRVPCGDGTKNTGLNVSVFTVYKPKNR